MPSFRDTFCLHKHRYGLFGKAIWTQWALLATRYGHPAIELTYEYNFECIETKNLPIVTLLCLLLVLCERHCLFIKEKIQSHATLGPSLSKLISCDIESTRAGAYLLPSVQRSRPPFSSASSHTKMFPGCISSRSFGFSRRVHKGKSPRRTASSTTHASWTSRTSLT